MSEKFRLKTATIALFPEDGRHVARVVPLGAVIDVRSLEGSKLIEVFWDGKNIHVVTPIDDLRRDTV